ncbi:MAG: MopE-related protein [Flavobacteriales bacterium]|nr:MAG: MopE-related protein [Flavobacteriales bacterium]
MAKRSLSLLTLLLLLLVTSGLHAQSSWVPGEVLVRLKQASDTALVRAQWLQQAQQGPVLQHMALLGEGSRYAELRFSGVVPSGEPELERLVATLPAVESTSLNYLVQRRAQPNDPQYGSQWHLADMNVEAAWDFSTGGATATGQRIAVGIVDSGVEQNHPDLAANVVFAGSAADEHGTQVAGVVGAVGNNGIGVSGVNWDVDLVSPANVTTLSDAFEQFQFCLNQRTLFNQSNGAQGRLIVALTVSWGIPNAQCGFGDPLFDDLGAAGILVVTAGPNDPTDIDVVADYPATCPNANNIVVTSYGQQDQVPFAVGDNTVHLLAPGLGIPTTDFGGGYDAVAGNSFAIPNVAGAVALLYSNDCSSFAQAILTDPLGTALQVKQAILSNVAPFPGGNAITITGGKLDVGAAYTALRNQCCPELTVTLDSPAGADAQYELMNGQGIVLAQGIGDVITFCAADGCFSVSVLGGDGQPVEGSFSASLGAVPITAGAITNGEMSFTLGTPVQGCTNPAAFNYDPAADCDDGSCCPEGMVQVAILTDEQGLTGTLDVTVTLAGAIIHDGPLPVADLPGYGVSGVAVTFCEAPGCLSVTVGASDVPLAELSLISIIDELGFQQQGFNALTGFFGPLGELSETCDGVDNDCDGAVDEEFMWYPDADGDGWGANVPAVISCTPMAGSVQQTGDCDDTNADVFPGASDPCPMADGIDNDCNGLADDQDGVFWFADADGDGWGSELDIVQACTQPPGYATAAGDCDDADETVFPGGPELCDGLDNDCDGEVDEGFTWYVDADGDGFGDEASAAVFCTPPLDLVQLGGDCDDSDADTYPGAPEGCDGVDRNCDGVIPGTNGTEVYSPNWTATATTGATVELYGLLAQGKTVVLDLFAAWCPPSQQMLTANFLQDWNAHMGPDGTDQIRIVAIAVDQSAGDVTPFIDEAQWPVIVQDGESFGTLYNAIGMFDNAVPTLLMICPDRSVTMLYGGPDALPYTGLFEYDAQAATALLNERCGCREACTTNIGCMDVNACDYDPNATCPGPCAQAQEWFVDNDGDGVGSTSLGTACTQPANSAPVAGDCNDDDPTVQQGFTLFVLTEDPGDFGTAHYVVQHSGGVLEGDLDLPAETEGIGELPVCIGAGCYSISITQNDVPLWEETILLFPGDEGEQVTFNTFDGYQGGGSAEVCDGVDNDCDGTVDEGCGNCDAADRAWILANQATIETIIGNNLNACLASGDQLACFTEALVQNTPLPEACAACVAQRYVCIISECLAACVSGFGTPECQACVNASCNAAYFACAGFTDADGDGFVAELDCDDANPNAYPGANELCDTIDNDCDGLVDETPTLYYADLDGDGWGDENNTVEGGCSPPNGATSQVGDCDDSNADIYPGAPELCNGIDDDCDGAVDDLAGTAYYADADGDGYGDINSEQFSCTPIPGLITQGGDCDDTDEAINPGAADPCDAIDQDCSGGPVLTTWFVDNDGDGFGNDATTTEDCTQPSGYVATGGDCDDSNSDVFPGNGCSNCTPTEQAWIAANQQTLLNALSDCALQCLGDPGCLAGCLQANGVPLGAACLGCVDGYLACVQDNCSFPCLNAPEFCFSCQVQAGCLAQLATCMGQVDADGDGWWAGSDCDDSNANAFPGAVEVCDGVDNDCDGSADEGLSVTYYTDSDGDGFGVFGTEITGTCEQPPGTATQGGDCDDADDTVYPGAPELCDGLDNDCDEVVDNEAGMLYYTDADGDSYGDDATAVYSCTPVPGAVTVGGDCNDADAAINPGAADPCDSIDQDCSGGPVIATWYLDNDGDGFGSEATSLDDCAPPGGYVALGGDCDDANSDLFPGNGCSNCTVTEQAWLAANQQTLLNAVGGCALQCLSGDPACIASCLQDEGIPLAAVCLTCVEEYIACTFDNCLIQCLGSEEACLECQLQSGCFASFASCLGMVDADGDGWWAGSDCDDANAAINPSAQETCDGIDNDCDGTVDDNAGDAYYPDADGDGFGDNDAMVLSCTPVPGLITQGGDCNDNDADVNPLGLELCNGLDDDCDGEVDEFNDSDGDGLEDCIDPCPVNAFLTPGDGCDDGNAATTNDAIGLDCLCAGTPVAACTTDLDLIWQPDGVSLITWELREQGTNALVQAGGGIYPDVSQYSEATCLPDGCFYLTVMDEGGDGIAGGGYQLKINSGARLIDNLTDAFGNGGFTSGVYSEIDGLEGFCLPLGSDRLIFTSCDRVDWKTSPCGGEFVVANDNPAVSAQYGVSNANSGYQMWLYNPNGGYSFKRFQSHSTSNGLPAGATRACHFQLNSWSGNQLQEGVLYNVKVRGRIAGNYLPWGPACRLVVNNAAAQCPRTKLMDIPGNQYLSCGQTRPVGTSQASLVHAKPVRRMNANCNWVSANRYQFRFRLPAEGFELVKNSAVGQYWVNTNGLQCDKTYEVDVRASFDGGATWCHSSDPWGDVCLLTTTCSNALVGQGTGTAAGTLRLYPNPNQGDQLMLSLSAVAEGVQTVSVDIFDLFGKRVAARTIPVQDGFVNSVLELNGELANGMYVVSITAGADSYTERLVIQR